MIKIEIHRKTKHFVWIYKPLFYFRSLFFSQEAAEDDHQKGEEDLINVIVDF